MSFCKLKVGEGCCIRGLDWIGMEGEAVERLVSRDGCEDVVFEFL